MTGQGDIRITFANGSRVGARLKVIGVGGAGGNAINRMIDEGLKGVDFIAVNTDVQDLYKIKEPAITLQIGEKSSRGLGAGSNPEAGRHAAEESSEQITRMLEGADMVFVTAGMGGGTGTGAAQVVARQASSMGILTVGVVTRPFVFEGNQRMRVAEEGIGGLMDSVDAMIVIPNEKIFDIFEDVDIDEGFGKVDEILLKAVRGISDIINQHGKHNVDFADVRTVLTGKGLTLMGTGESKGENRAQEAALMAINSPLLDSVSIEGATGLLYNITASKVTMRELRTIGEILNQHASPQVISKFGIVEEENMKDTLRVTVIATGFSGQSSLPQSVSVTSFSDPSRRVAPTQRHTQQGVLFPEDAPVAASPSATSVPLAEVRGRNQARPTMPTDPMAEMWHRRNTPDDMDRLWASTHESLEQVLEEQEVEERPMGYLDERTLPSMKSGEPDPNADPWEIPTFARKPIIGFLKRRERQ